MECEREDKLDLPRDLQNQSDGRRRKHWREQSKANRCVLFAGRNISGATSAGERTHRGEANPSTGDGLSFDPATESAQTKGHPPNGVPFAPRGGVQEAWVGRYNGPGNLDDDARAIVVDGSGNAYVTGETFGSGN
jgi:Beta-propeller repeat